MCEYDDDGLGGRSVGMERSWTSFGDELMADSECHWSIRWYPFHKTCVRRPLGGDQNFEVAASACVSDGFRFRGAVQLTWAMRRER